MITLRKSTERGHANHGWLDTYHTFSFADYYDPNHMGFRSLRVINDDIVSADHGFDMHPHRNMEIISYVVSGALQHKDSMGNTAIIRPGEIQRMSAGKGVLHSEFNPSESESVRLLQIWIQPDTQNLEPSYEQQQIPETPSGSLTLLAAPQGKGALVTIHQDVKVYSGKFQSGDELNFSIDPGRGIWVQVVRGTLEINGNKLADGDALAIEQENSYTIRATESSEILVFDLS